MSPQFQEIVEISQVKQPTLLDLESAGELFDALLPDEKMLAAAYIEGIETAAGVFGY